MELQKRLGYELVFKDNYPKKNDIIRQVAMARTIEQIIQLFETLSQLRRVPPGTTNNYTLWNDYLHNTDEAGILQRVAQTSLITIADVIPNLNGTYTYMIDTGMSFHSLKK